MRRPIKVSGECREIKHKIVIPVRFRRSSNGDSGLPTATGSGLLRNNVRVLIPILIARRKDDARVCNYITATDRRFAFGNKDAFIKSAPATARPFPFSVSRLSTKAGALSPSPCWFMAAFFLFLYEDRDVSKDSDVVFVELHREPNRS